MTLSRNLDLISRQLSIEKSTLESYCEEKSKQKDRVSMQFEQLQWRLRNKMEIPSTQLLTNNQIMERPLTLPQSLNKAMPKDHILEGRDSLTR